ncbi:hypothetical protein ASPSYDRAFT_50996 [Aspergillus sydowii CBS 593.65]|uniref:Uncharacterized protein n=1 Tax=Aspergillus sydowii CBS 593.65 TaxID=1036612 RepID=A0A1L9T279_9EURO|nr:uncharacterized protein ASPSYDRAFT_50996 [Aspergillus sydowii CBS 593.65]OJJ53495.1 hypothetical protein ASPSYDRAFT_50996 [Aspergillus sydowii CBS 593.65]
MSWSNETIIALVTLLVTLPPSALVIWTYLKRRLRGGPPSVHSRPATISSNFFFSSFSRNITFSYTGDPNALLESGDCNLEDSPVPIVPRYSFDGMQRRFHLLPLRQD